MAINADYKEVKVKGVLLFLLFIYFLFYAYNLTGWLMHDDEGNYLYQAWRMTEGEIPYKDFYTPKEPLFLITGSVIFNLFGLSVFWIRLFSIFATLFTGYAIFLIGRRAFDSQVGLISALFYLILPIVYSQARLYRPDAYAVFFSAFGLLIFLKAWQDNSKASFFCSGLLYAISLGYKFSGILGVLALVSFVIARLFTEKKNSLIIKSILFSFMSGFILPVTFLLILIAGIAPSFFNCVIGHQTNQPTLSSHTRIYLSFMANIKSLLFAPLDNKLGLSHSWLIIISFFQAIRYLFSNNVLKKIIAFYALSIILILFSPYPDNFLRYLLYLLPVAVLLCVDLLFYLLGKNRNLISKALGVFMLVIIILKVLIPGLVKDAMMSGAKENDTLRLARYINKNTAESEYVVADYGDIIFYAKRKTLPITSSVSKSTFACNVITGEKLISQFQKHPVKLVLIHKKGGIPERLSIVLGETFLPHHFVTLLNTEEGVKFTSYLKENFKLKGSFNRTGQIYDIYVRN